MAAAYSATRPPELYPDSNTFCPETAFLDHGPAVGYPSARVSSASPPHNFGKTVLDPPTFQNQSRNFGNRLPVTRIFHNKILIKNQPLDGSQVVLNINLLLIPFYFMSSPLFYTIKCAVITDSMKHFVVYEVVN